MKSLLPQKDPATLLEEINPHVLDTFMSKLLARPWGAWTHPPQIPGQRERSDFRTTVFMQGDS